jgi:hypothetical protein
LRVKRTNMVKLIPYIFSSLSYFRFGTVKKGLSGIPIGLVRITAAQKGSSASSLGSRAPSENSSTEATALQPTVRLNFFVLIFSFKLYVFFFFFFFSKCLFADRFHYLLYLATQILNVLRDNFDQKEILIC